MFFMGALDALGMAETPGAVTSMGKTALVAGGELLGWASTILLGVATLGEVGSGARGRGRP